MANLPDIFTPDIEAAREAENTADWSSRLPEMRRELADARTYLLLRHHFFGRVVLGNEFIFTDKLDTAAVRADLTIFFNPGFWDQLDVLERAFVLAHEAMHPMLLCFDRRGDRDPRLWNEAQDHFINLMLIEAGLKMPEREDLRGLADPRFKGMSDVQIYEILLAERKQMLEDLKEMLAQSSCCPECGRNLEQNSSQPEQGAEGQSQNGQQQQSGEVQAPQQGAGEQSQGSQQQQQSGATQASQQDSNDQNQSGQQQSGGAQEPQTRCQTCGGTRPLGHAGPGQSTQHNGRGFGRNGGDVDFGATEKLQQDAQEGRGKRVPTATELRNKLIAIAHSTETSGRGTVPAGIQRLIEELTNPEVSWSELLERYASQILRSGRSYHRLSRRTGAINMAMEATPGYDRPSRIAGVSLPGPKRDLDPATIVIDSSGSRSNKEIGSDLAEVREILSKYQVPVRVMVHDVDVHFDEEVQDVDEIEILGGGGTSSLEVFKKIEESPGRLGRPPVVIWFTDLEIDFPPEPPPYPVLWVYVGHGKPPEPPFGTVIERNRYRNPEIEDYKVSGQARLKGILGATDPTNAPVVSQPLKRSR